jgi:hypothetical protein
LIAIDSEFLIAGSFGKLFNLLDKIEIAADFRYIKSAKNVPFVLFASDVRFQLKEKTYLVLPI